MTAPAQLSLFGWVEVKPFHFHFIQDADRCRLVLQHCRGRCYCISCDAKRLTESPFHKPRLFTLPRCMVAAGLSWGEWPWCMEGMDDPIAPQRYFGQALPL